MVAAPPNKASGFVVLKAMANVTTSLPTPEATTVEGVNIAVVTVDVMVEIGIVDACARNGVVAMLGMLAAVPSVLAVSLSHGCEDVDAKCGHCRHDAPLDEKTSPHIVHAELPLSEKKPTSHSKHELLLAGAYLPGRHS